MKLTRASNYAIHAVAYIAQQKHDRPIASHHIAKARKIPTRFLLKVLKPLVSVRVLISIKGPSGGYRLAKPATQISLLEVIEAVDGQIRGTAPFSEEGNGVLNDRIEAACKQSAEAVRKQLERVRLSDLVGAKKH
jgi:Rrf2 family protein